MSVEAVSAISVAASSDTPKASTLSTLPRKLLAFRISLADPTPAPNAAKGSSAQNVSTRSPLYFFSSVPQSTPGISSLNDEAIDCTKMGVMSCTAS